LDQGVAHMGVARASGKNKIQMAADMAIKSPLLETTIAGAHSVIISFAGDSSLALKDINLAAQTIKEAVDPEATIIFGATINDDLKDEVMVTVIATGLEDDFKVLSKSGRVSPRAEARAEEEAEAFEEAKPKEELPPIREMEDSDAPFEIPIFLQRKRN